MLELVTPDLARRTAWQEAHRAWGPGLHEDGFGIGPHDDVDSDDGFAAWVSEVRDLPSASLWWIVEDDLVLGGIALRSGPEEEVRRLGHVGYGIRPDARGRGIATWALDQVLDRARESGLPRLLLVCLDDNKASSATIERNGGRLEGITHEGERRYWIDL